MGVGNKDLFSRQAKQYARFRPDYPKELFDFIVEKVSCHKLAWDCATGNGQAACSLADYFDQVVATDVSAAQIANAKSNPNVHYRVASAYASDLEDASIDCITVAQALHWFANDAFYREVKRVIRPNAILAAWGYTVPTCDEPLIQKKIASFYSQTLKEYWADERHYVDEKYSTIFFPFANTLQKSFYSQKRWSLFDLVGYFSSWSAVQTYKEKNKLDPVETIFTPELMALWGDAEQKNFQFEIFLRIAKF